MLEEKYRVQLTLNTIRVKFSQMYKNFRTRRIRDQAALDLLRTIEEIRDPLPQKRSGDSDSEDEPPQKKQRLECDPHCFKPFVLEKELILFCKKCGIKK